MTHRFDLRDPIQITKHNWPEEMDPTVSIDCKTYMHRLFIRDAIEGFLMQKTTFKVEILIHDDASTDGTTEIVKEYAAKYPKLIKATCQIENQYKKKPKTEKFIKPPKSMGKYIAKCEGDDYWTDSLKLQKQVMFLENNPDYTITCGNYLTEDVNFKKFKASGTGSAKTKKEEYIFSLEDFSEGWITKTLTVVFRANARNPNDLVKYKYRRDVHLFYHLLKAGKGYYFNDIFGVYRIHSGGIFSSKSKAEKLILRYKIYRELFMENKDETSRSLFFNATLSLLIYNSFRFIRVKTDVGNWDLFKTCIKFFRIKNDFHRFFKNPFRVFKTLLSR